MTRSFDTRALRDAQLRLAALFAERPHLAARAQDIEPLHTQAQRAVFRLLWDGRPAIAKLIWHSAKIRAVNGQTSALKQMAETLENRPAHVPQVLHIAPKAGFFVISFVAGKSGDDLLRETGSAALPELTRAAHLWLSEATRNDRRQGPFPKTHVETLLAACAEGPASEVVARTRMLLRSAPETLTLCRGHGDFWPGNLITGPEGVTAIDLSGRPQTALVEDIACFAQGLAEQSEFGLTPEIAAPLLALLPEPEATRAFPIFSGVALARKLQAGGGLGYAHERARFLAETF